MGKMLPMRTIKGAQNTAEMQDFKDQIHARHAGLNQIRAEYGLTYASPQSSPGPDFSL